MQNTCHSNVGKGVAEHAAAHQERLHHLGSASHLDVVSPSLQPGVANDRPIKVARTLNENGPTSRKGDVKRCSKSVFKRAEGKSLTCLQSDCFCN